MIRRLRTNPLLTNHENQDETVVAFGADRLDCGRLDPGLGGEHLVEVTLGGVWAVADDVVATIRPPERVCPPRQSRWGCLTYRPTARQALTARRGGGSHQQKVRSTGGRHPLFGWTSVVDRLRHGLRPLPELRRWRSRWHETGKPLGQARSSYAPRLENRQASKGVSRVRIPPPPLGSSPVRASRSREPG